MKILNDLDEAIAEAASALAEGEVVAYPAETMYGLGVDPFSTTAIGRLFKVKGRPETNPIPVIIANAEQLSPFVPGISDDAQKLIARFWPGPLSLVLPKSDSVPHLLTAGRDDICVRCPGSAVARTLCERFGSGITSTSANPSGNDPARRVDQLQLEGVAVAIDAGGLDPGPASTIYDVANRIMLREGPIAADAIAACLAE